MGSSRSWQTEPLHWTWIGPKTVGCWMHYSPLNEFLIGLLYSYSTTSNVATSSETTFFGVSHFAGISLSGSRDLATRNPAKQTCRFIISFLMFFVDIFPAVMISSSLLPLSLMTSRLAVTCGTLGWDPSERKVGETATSLQPEGNAEAQPSNSSIWSPRSQHDWSKEVWEYLCNVIPYDPDIKWLMSEK